MKKFTLLLVALLAIVKITFGQKGSQLLWETKVGSVDKVTYLSTAFCSKVGEESTIIGNNLERSAIDKNGNVIWRYPYFDILGRNNFVAVRNDTLYRLDKELKFINSIKIPRPRNLYFTIFEVSDGYIVTDTKTDEIIKWDYELKETWRYKDISNNLKYVGYAGYKETTSGYTFDYSSINQDKNKAQLFSLKLDKKGKKVDFILKDIIPSLYKLGTEPILTSDKGVWVHESPFGGIGESIMSRLDSTGKEITRFVPSVFLKTNGRPDALLVYSDLNGYYDLPLGVTPNGSLIYGFYTVDSAQNPKSLFFVKIDGISKLIFTDEIPVTKDFSSGYLSFASVRVIDEDNFIFSLNKRYDKDELIGAANFKVKNSIWANKAYDDYRLANQNSRGPLVIEKDNALPIIRNDSLICYSIEGKIKWLKANVKQYNYFGKDTYRTVLISYLYITRDDLTTKIRISDGKELWSLKLKPSKIISEDSEGNCYLYQETVENISIFNRKYTVDFISKTGKITSIYNSPNKDFNQIGIPGLSLSGDIGRYQIDDKNKFFYSHALEKQVDGTFQFIYRKYSTRCAYDLEATAQATGNTEVCSGTKVKLSTTKQDGLTYQWQKDGKDIPTFKDIIHDVDESGNYTVTVKDEICQNQTVSNPIKVTIKPTPEANITTDLKGVIYEPFTVKMTANSGTGLAYQWLKDDAIIPNETTANYEAKQSGKYNVSVTQDGCVKISDALNISILIPLANEREIGEEQVQVFPNPSKGEFEIVLPKSLKSADIQLFDSYGRERSLLYSGEQAQAEGLVQGVYFLRVNKGEKSITNKIVIE